ncbi:MAG TPA: hypothetical protein DCL41_00720 [Bdellovibrionales bacterium]|nr:hypothetical protein [Pseudobdellovibrionaceae bacterium]HAG90359.1 hypothetical protein [Bdellovibrionales bacterium]|tara:strand:+ start:6452 stop:7207 length:756 start_codon:yes stop_codon:yes gene_type:complete
MLNLIFLLVFAENLRAQNQVDVPKGHIEAFWQAPVKEKSFRPLLLVDAFKAMIYPVTQKQFGEFLAKNPEWTKDNVSRIFADENYLSNYLEESSMEQTPITNVSWFAARAYCKSKGMRLPTVKEWEYLAAASETQRNANRNNHFLSRILSWYGEPKKGRLPNVGSIYQNIYGLWDMHGLIWEWVEDFNSNFVSGESREDSSFNKNLFCGAGALSMADKENYAAFMRFAFRSGLKGTSTIWNLGFRCVRSLQ